VELRGIPQFDSGGWKLRLERMPLDPDNEATMDMEFDSAAQTKVNDTNEARAKDDAEQLQWRDHLIDLGYNVTPVMDRDYFHSIYFREPGGVLFEIATDPPGFTLDEKLKELGTHLRLPPWLEPARSQIEQVLPPIRVPRTTGEIKVSPL